MKTIGIIGGIGPQATMALESYIHEASLKRIPVKGNSGYAPLWVTYLREAPVQLGSDGKPAEPRKPSEALLSAARKLGGLADMIAISSNSPHVFIEDVRRESGKPVINMIELVVAHIKKTGFKKVGIMGISGSIKNKLYETPLAREGIAYESMSLEQAPDLDVAIFKVMEGREDASDKKVAIRILNELRTGGCDCIILGCTEIPFLLSAELQSKDIINPLRILAEEIVTISLS
jgi:aspartate racemase